MFMSLFKDHFYVFFFKNDIYTVTFDNIISNIETIEIIVIHIIWGGKMHRIFTPIPTYVLFHEKFTT